MTFDALLRTELTAMGHSERMRLSGPQGIPLRSSGVQILGLALHELATNALKYGALAQPEGQLEVIWRIEYKEAGERPWLHVQWVERGVQLPAGLTASPQRGKGRELIERALPHQLGAITHYEFASDGVRCSISLPVSGSSPARATS